MWNVKRRHLVYLPWSRRIYTPRRRRMILILLLCTPCPRLRVNSSSMNPREQERLAAATAAATMALLDRHPLLLLEKKTLPTRPIVVCHVALMVLSSQVSNVVLHPSQVPHWHPRSNPVKKKKKKKKCRH